MKLIRSIAMDTDHTYHGTPCEVTRVDLYISEDVITPDVLRIAKQNQVMRLHEHAKRMPHRYWQKPEGRPYASELLSPAAGNAQRRIDMCDSGEAEKKPRLFYWEEAEDAWLPASLAIEDNFAEAEMSMLTDGEEKEIKIKRVDMTDAEYEAMPED